MVIGGMGTLPHDRAVIIPLSITKLMHGQACGMIFALTVIKTATVRVVIFFFHLPGKNTR